MNKKHIIKTDVVENVDKKIIRFGKTKRNQSGESKTGNEGNCERLNVLLKKRNIKLKDINEQLKLEIAERKLAEMALRESEEAYRFLIETMNEGLCLLNEKMEIKYINTKFIEMVGASRNDLMDLSISELLRPEERNSFCARFNRTNNGLSDSFEVSLCNFMGHNIDALASCRMLVNGRNEFAGSLMVLTDIGDRKKIEETMRQSIREKELLLKEVHHRIKNNLQIITSLISLQSEKMNYPGIISFCDEIIQRIRSISLIHEQFNQTEDFSKVELGEYVKNLVKNILNSLCFSTIVPIIDADKVFVDINKAVYLGLIINEIVCNSLKHAFDEKEEGQVVIFIKKSGKGLTVSIKDNGKGLPPDFDYTKSGTLGLELVNTLTQQLKGEIKLTVNNGTEFKIILPMMPYKVENNDSTPDCCC